MKRVTMLPVVRMAPMSAALALAAQGALAQGVAAPDAAAGKAVFAQCAACHTVDAESPVGPTLKGVFGRKSGSVEGFRYSRAMKNAAVTWDERSLDAYLADPQAFMPGNLMPFAGVPAAADRAALIVYLRSAP